MFIISSIVAIVRRSSWVLRSHEMNKDVLVEDDLAECGVCPFVDVSSAESCRKNKYLQENFR